MGVLSHMSENTMTIDFSSVGNIEDFRSVPEGDYPCRISEIRESKSPAGHSRWGIRWEVCHGEWQGRTACWDSLHWSERGLPRAKFLLGLLGFEIQGPLEIDARQLEGKQALVTVVSEEREDPVTGIRRLRNRVPYSGYGTFVPPKKSG